MLENIFKSGLLLVALLLAPTPLYADDTEIYFSRAGVGNDENEQIANVLFLIDTSGSMEQGNPTKMSQLKAAFTQVIDGLGEGVRVGVGKFNGGYDRNGYGGYVFYPVSDMDSTARGEVKSLVNGLSGTSNTPTMEAYSEMARYMMGLSPTTYAVYGEASQDEPQVAVNMHYQCVRYFSNGSCRDWDWVSDDSYQSPMNINNQCESNHIIVMTDGDPTQDSDYDSVRNIAGGYCNGSYSCQEQLAGWLASESGNTQERAVKTWQVAFGVSETSSQVRNMTSVAVAGGTERVRLANDAEELAAEFNDILNLIAEDSQTITSPGVAVNQNNRLEHLNQLYYAVFKPSKSSVWPGNLKRYRKDGSEVVDKNGSSAVDANTGYFRDSAWSYWTPTEADGPDVTKGGARGRNDQYQDRKIYVGNNSDNGGGEWLTENRVENILQPAQMGIPDNDPAAEFDTKLKVYDALKRLWADPMHSVPLLVNYEIGADANDVDGQKNYLFVSTNGGMLHAIDTDDGREKFTFMPDRMLKKAYDFVRSPDLREDNIRDPYGMDGSWVAYRTAKENGDADKVWIFGGMRRGGNAYYGLDVSSMDSPELMWRIQGKDESGANASSGFDRLGQTWSTPTITRVRIDGEVKTVLVFGGGYDAEHHDTAGQRAAKDSVGNAIYMVDAETGDLIWSAGADTNAGVAHTTVDSMKWSVPGGIAVVDLKNGRLDGLTDHLYFADLGGQVFRVNFDNNNDGAASLVKGVVRLANFGDSEHRRFYEAPAIGYVRDGLQETLYVAVGSGYRAHPLDEDTDEGFFIFADSTFQNTNQPDVITMSELRNARSSDPSASSKGWYVTFQRSGEKVMSSPSIYQNSVMFTTYVPTNADQDDDPCVVRYGTAYAYRADMITGEPASFTNDGEASWDGTKLITSAIPPGVVPVITDGGGGDGDGGGDDDEDGSGVSFNVGLEFIGDDGMNYNLFRKRRWYPMEKNDANAYFPPEQGGTTP